MADRAAAGARDRRDGHVVYVRPELVVEIAFDGMQTSPRYPGGVALRFARVKGYRPDKRPTEADTLDAVLRLQFSLTPPSGVMVQCGLWGDLPRVTVRVDEDRGVAAPKGLGRLAADRRSGGARFLGDGIDLRTLEPTLWARAGPPQPPASSTTAVRGEPGRGPRAPGHHVARLEEDDVVIGVAPVSQPRAS